MFSAIRKAWGAVKRVFTGHPISALAFRNLVGADETVQDPFKDVPWVFAAIDWKAKNTARLPVQVMTGQRGDPSLSKAVPNHPFQQVLERPNRAQNAFEFWWTVVVHFCNRGAVFIVMPDRETPFDFPQTMWATSPRRWEPIEDDEGKLEAWEFRGRRGKRERFELWEVVVIRFPDPDDPNGWMSPLESAERGIASIFGAETFNEAFYRNSAMPGGLIKASGKVDEPEARRIKKEWIDLYGGAMRAHSIALLEEGLSFEALQVSQRDMEFIRSQEWNRELIFIVTGVWPEIFGVGQTTFANRAEARLDVWESTMLPLLEWISLAFWHQLFSTADGGKVWIQFDTSEVQALQADLAQRIEHSQKLWGMGTPLKVLNQRFHLELPEFEGWDTGYLPAGLVPVSEVASDDGDPFGGEDEQPEALEFLEPIQEDVLEVAERLEAATRLALPAVTVVENGSVRRAAVRGNTRWARELRKMEKKFKAKIRRSFFDLRKAILRRMAQLDKKGEEFMRQRILLAASVVLPRMTGADEAAYFRAFSEADAERLIREIFTKGDTAEKLERSLRPLYSESYRMGALQVVGELGLDESAWEPSPELLRAQRKRARRVKRVSTTVKRRIAAALAKGLEEEDNISGLQTRVKDVFKTTDARALMIARTETAGAMGDARFQQLKAEGIDRHEWITSGDELVRDTHKRENGHVQDIGKRFPVTKLRYPNDPTGKASEVINCRCRVIPVVD